MTTIEKINSLFKKFNVNLEVAEPSKEEVAKVEMMAEGVLDDGTKIGTSADAWAEGVDIFIVDADGNQQPLPDGEYKLTDGTTLLVESGILKMITPVEVQQEEEVKVEEVENSAEPTITNAQVEALMNLVAKLEVALSEEKKKNALNETKVAELSKAPAVESVKNSKQTNNTNKNVQLKSFKKMTYAERVSNILNK